MEENPQGELFNDIEKPRKKWGFNFIRPQFVQKRFSFSLSRERIALISIAGIVILIAAYSLGVEAGKRARLIVREQSPLHKKASAVKKPVSYAIFVDSYKSKPDADKQVNYLRSKGFLASMVMSGQYYKVYVEKYLNLKQAQSDLHRLKARYKDAAILSK